MACLRCLLREEKGHTLLLANGMIVSDAIPLIWSMSLNPLDHRGMGTCGCNVQELQHKLCRSEVCRLLYMSIVHHACSWKWLCTMQADRKACSKVDIACLVCH
jgi:hypothetical protein